MIRRAIQNLWRLFWMEIQEAVNHSYIWEEVGVEALWSRRLRILKSYLPEVLEFSDYFLNYIFLSVIRGNPGKQIVDYLFFFVFSKRCLQSQTKLAFKFKVRRGWRQVRLPSYTRWWSSPGRSPSCRWRRPAAGPTPHTSVVTPGCYLCPKTQKRTHSSESSLYSERKKHIRVYQNHLFRSCWTLQLLPGDIHISVLASLL